MLMFEEILVGLVQLIDGSRTVSCAKFLYQGLVSSKSKSNDPIHPELKNLIFFISIFKH
jgi:hypothetical protein